jgi:hypothetical protein
MLYTFSRAEESRVAVPLARGLLIGFVLYYSDGKIDSGWLA